MYKLAAKYAQKGAKNTQKRPKTAHFPPVFQLLAGS
jgi:hypothetical protein